MSITAPVGGGADFEPLKEGTHLAVCVGIIDLGLQETNFGEKRQLRLEWITPDELKDNGEPFRIGKTYTLSMNSKSSLRKDIANWIGGISDDDAAAAFDITTLAGKGCQITVTHRTGNTGRVYANVSGVTGLPKGVTADANGTEPVVIEVGQRDKVNDLPEWLGDKVLTGWGALNGSKDAGGESKDFDDDIPF